jgi:hypothetical protein
MKLINFNPGKEPLYYYLRFRVACLIIALFFGLLIMAYRDISKLSQQSKMYRELYIEKTVEYRYTRYDLDMLADILTSNGQLGIVRYYCDSFKKWDEQRLSRLRK